jgi:hypothetical protein
VEALKGQVAFDDRIGTQLDVGRQFALQPATGAIYDFRFTIYYFQFRGRPLSHWLLSFLFTVWN